MSLWDVPPELELELDAVLVGAGVWAGLVFVEGGGAACVEVALGVDGGGGGGGGGGAAEEDVLGGGADVSGLGADGADVFGGAGAGGRGGGVEEVFGASEDEDAGARLGTKSAEGFRALDDGFVETDSAGAGATTSGVGAMVGVSVGTTTGAWIGEDDAGVLVNDGGAEPSAPAGVMAAEGFALALQEKHVNPRALSDMTDGGGLT